MIDSMFQSSTDQVLDDQVQRPRPAAPQKTAFSLWGMARGGAKGVGGGVAESLAFGAELAGAFGQVEGSYPDAFGVRLSDEQKQQAEAARRKMLTQGIDFSNEAGDVFRSRAKELMPDPNTTHAAEQVTAGIANFATKAVSYSLFSGPAAPILLGGDAGLTEADKLKQEGVDLETRTKAGAVAGTVAGASIVLPVVGSTALKTAGLVAAAGPGSFMAQNAATKAILDNAGYHEIANQYNPFDPVGLAVSTLVPSAFGLAALRMRAGRGEPAQSAGPLKTEADVKQSVQLTAAEQAASDAFEASPANLAELRGAIAKEKNPENRALLQAELTKQEAAAAHGEIRAAIAQNPELVDAARVKQVADTLDSYRLTPDEDVGGMAVHQQAIEKAQDMINRGERVDVADMLADHPLDPARAAEAQDRYAYLFGDMQPKYTVPEASQASMRFDAAGRPEIRTQGILLTDAHPTSRIEAIDTDLTRFAIRSPEGEVLGFTDLALKDGKVVSLYDIETTPGLRNRGTAGKVIEAITSLDPDRKIDISNIVDEAVPFWEKVGAQVSDGNRSPTLDWHQFAESHVGRSRAAPRRSPGLVENASAFDAPAAAGNERAPLAGEARELTDAEAAAAFGFHTPEEPGAAAPAARSADAAEHAALDRQATQTIALHPDLMVQLDGMAEPVRAGELLEQVRKDADQDRADAPLLEVAANCFLRG